MTGQFGDFQTPSALVDAVFRALPHRPWTRVLEPTCGRGHFIAGALSHLPGLQEVHGIELQAEHVETARRAFDGRVCLHEGNLFDLDLARDLVWHGDGPLLVVGNPPWVTSAALGGLGSANRAPKANPRALQGLDAMTGAANVDLAEAILVKLVRELAHERPTIALLCKTSVARQIVAVAHARGLPVRAASLRRIDAKRWFGAAVDAGLFTLELDPDGPAWNFELPVYADLEATVPERVFALVNGRPVADLARYHGAAFADGPCPVVWRQGLKHDAAAVMELTDGGSGRRLNGHGEVVAVEPAFVFPLVKGGMLFNARPDAPARFVIVPQRTLGEETASLARRAPALWAYLSRHQAAFGMRKSAIYRARPPYSIFGIGPYAFAPYKVAVAGLYKTPRFRALGPRDGQPVMLDDTSYFLPCASALEAARLKVLLDQPVATALIAALSCRDGMRPITKQLLRRLDLGAIAARMASKDLQAGVEAELDALGEPLARKAWPASWNDLG